MGSKKCYFNYCFPYNLGSGRIIGKAIMEKCMLECYFTPSIYKMILGQTLNFKDLQDIDNHLYTGLNWCLLPESDVEMLYETFSID